MLILTRYPGQEIVIGDDIVITVLKNDQKSDRVKLGFSAPNSVDIHRREVYDRIKINELMEKGK